MDETKRYGEEGAQSGKKPSLEAFWERPQSGDSSLENPLELILRSRRLIALCVLIAMALFFAYYVVAPTRYEASSQILIVAQKPQILRPDSETAGLDLTRYLVGPVIDSQVEIIGSDRLALEVIEQLGLHEDPDFYEESFSIIGMIRGLLSFYVASDPETDAALVTESGVSIPAEVVERYREGLDVGRKGLTLILQVSFTDENRFRAARIANAISESYLSDQQASRREVSSLLAQQLGERVDELREQLLSRQAFLQDYIAENRLVSVGGLTVAEREIAETISLLVAARAELAQQDAELAQLMVEGDGTEGQTPAGGGGSSESHMASELRYQVHVFETKIALLEGRLTGLTDEFARKSKLAIRRDEIEREVNATRDLYSALLLRLKETLVEGSILYPEARIIDPASIPIHPAGLRKLFILVGFMLGGLFIGISIALFRKLDVYKLDERRGSTGTRTETVG